MIHARTRAVAPALALLLVASLGWLAILLDRAEAATSTSSYKPGPDRKSWYWARQRDEVVEGGPIAQRLRAPSPQDPQTLPVAAADNAIEKMSAIAFDLGERNVPIGAAITRAALTIQEGIGPRDFPAFNTDGKIIRACAILDFWPDGDAEEMADAPTWNREACVDGARNEKADPPTWSFDITSLASTWGSDPSTSQGVMLVPKILSTAPAQEGTWQINLRIPAPDDDLTPNDEYAESRTRARIDLTYSAAAPASDAGASFDGSSSSGAGPAPEPALEAPPPAADPAPEPAPAAEPPAQGTQAVAAPGPVSTPPVMWLLIPIGIAGALALRALLLDDVTSMRSDGVLASIHSLNAARRTGAPQGG